MVNPEYVFLDRDGTLIEHIPYLCDPSRVKLEDGVAETLRFFLSAGFELIIVTNQSSIGRGICDNSKVKSVNDRMVQLFAEEGVSFKEILMCPHRPDDNCFCRKPKTGLLENYNLSLNEHSLRIMIGDQESDMEFGRRISARCILYRNPSNFESGTNSSKAYSSWSEIKDVIYGLC
jgi:histidinol-phosphate phosphatase family protein